jgi:hypothetical protein
VLKPTPIMNAAARSQRSGWDLLARTTQKAAMSSSNVTMESGSLRLSKATATGITASARAARRAVPEVETAMKKQKAPGSPGKN